MQFSHKLFLTFVLICFVSTTYGKQKSVQDQVVEKATHIKDTVADGVKTGSKLASDGAKAAAEAAKTAGSYRKIAQ